MKRSEVYRDAKQRKLEATRLINEDLYQILNKWLAKLEAVEPSDARDDGCYLGPEHMYFGRMWSQVKRRTDISVVEKTYAVTAWVAIFGRESVPAATQAWARDVMDAFVLGLAQRGPRKSAELDIACPS